MRPLIPVLSMQVTYQCNVACRHCGPYCAPEEKDWMTVEEIRDLIAQAAELGAATVVFTGGEPSLLGDELPPLFRLIHEELRVPNSRIVTNGKFGSSYDKAKRILASWQDAGLVEVNISCGEFHQEFIPIESVANAYRAACDLGFRTVLLAGEFLSPGKGKVSPEAFEAAVGRPLLNPEDTSPYTRRCHGMSTGGAMPYGRGRDHISLDDIDVRPEAEISSMCDDVLTAFTVHPNGNLTACCGIMVRDESLLNLGNWRTTRLRPLAERAHQDVILNWIRYRGLRDMKAWLQAKDPTLGLRDQYQNICDLCADIVYNRRCQELLVQHGQERRNEIVAAKVATDAVRSPPQRFAYGDPV
jgi:hypothetical protein